jgi:hypothetical protein
VKFVFEELQKMEVWLSDYIEGYCQGIERRMADSEQRVEERLVSLEMARIESKSGCAEIEKWVEGLKLEVHHVGRFLKRGNLGDPQGKPRIFGTVELAQRSSPPTGDADVPSGHRVANSHRDRELGSVFTHTQVPVNNTSQSMPPDSGVGASLERSHDSHSAGEFTRMGQGHLPKLQFPVFWGEDPQLWKSRCKNYFEMYGVEESL